MSVDLSNSLVGLSLLSGSNAFASGTSAVTVESRAVRTAKAQFTLPPTTPPWKQAATTTPLSAQVSAIRALKTIIDPPATGPDALPADVQTSFTTYKALDRMRLLAESAIATTTSDAQRGSLQATFAKGLEDLQAFLAKAPNGVADIAFGQPARYAKSIAISTPDQFVTRGTDLVAQRGDPLPGLTGQEQFSITLDRPGANDVLTVDLAQTPQPPTLDSVAAAINAAIAAIPLRNPDGSVRLDDNGNPVPKWLVHFVPDKDTDAWGLSLENPGGVERVSIDQVGAKDSLIVATGQTTLDSPTATRIFRFDDPNGANEKRTLATLDSVDRIASARAQAAGITTGAVTTFKTDAFGKTTASTEKTSIVHANTDAAAITTDAQGNSYILGTTRGDIGGIRSTGGDNLFLTKIDGSGNIVWQRGLGAGGSSSGAAVTIAANGDVVVAGTVNGTIAGVQADGDMVVARYSANGDEKFTSVLRSAGADSARAVAVGNDGSVFVAGRENGGDALVARIDGTGKVAERRTIDSGGSDTINALAIGSDGNVLALINSDGVASVRRLGAAALTNELGSITLGRADARALVAGADGSIVVGGAANEPLNGTQINGIGGGRDGFVARIDAGLGGASITYIGSASDDQVDSIAVTGTTIYAGGRTTGAVGAQLAGATDGFIARIDKATGAIGGATQFGQAQTRTEPVRLAFAEHGAATVDALGFARGTINPGTSARLTTQTSLAAGDFFTLIVDGGAARRVTITADDTMTTLAARINAIAGSGGSASAPRIAGQQALRIDAKSGHAIQLLAGTTGQDALFKLGLAPQRIETPLAKDAHAPAVAPGGAFGLALGEGLNLATAAGAKASLAAIKSALSVSQSAYRSLYWDDGKAKVADSVKNGQTGTHSTARETAQLANYTAALKRLTGG